MNRRSLKIATGLATTRLGGTVWYWLSGSTNWSGCHPGELLPCEGRQRTGGPVRVGMIGYDRDANLRVDLRNGGSWTGNLYAGQRVVVAWDRNRSLVHAAEVEIDRSGTLRLQSMLPMYAPQPDGPRMCAKDAPRRCRE